MNEKRRIEKNQEYGLLIRDEKCDKKQFLRNSEEKFYCNFGLNF